MPFASHITLNQLPPYLENISRGGLERASALSQAQYAPFQGPRVAPMGNDLDRVSELSRREGLYLPYLESAQRGYGQATNPFYSEFQNYLNPMARDIEDSLRTQADQFWRESILPSLESRFVRAGHYGSSLHQQAANKSARELQQQMLNQQRLARAGIHQQAAQIFATDQSRRMDAARQMADLGRQRQAGHLSDIAALESSGERARGVRQEDLDSGYRAFLEQREYPWQQLSNLSGAIAGTPYSSQGAQYMHQQPNQQLNRWGQVGSLAGQLYGLNRAGGNRGFKKGGKVSSNKLKMKSGLASIKKKVK